MAKKSDARLISVIGEEARLGRGRKPPAHVKPPRAENHTYHGNGGDNDQGQAEAKREAAFARYKARFDDLPQDRGSSDE